jgi:glycosyltransferase involved in cell wall biosynthesis
LRILIALSYSPYPVLSGTDRLIMNLIRGLSARHEIRLVTMTLKEKNIEILKEIENEQVSVSSILAPHRRGLAYKVFYKLRNIISAFLFMIPMQTLYAAPGKYLRLVARVSRQWKADIVLVNYWHLYKLQKIIKDSETILLTHDLDYLVNPGRISSISGLFRKWLKGVDLAMKRRIEKKAYRIFDRILTVTGKEAKELKAFLDDENKLVKALPMAIDLDKFNPGIYQRQRNRVLFVGNFGSDFNADALSFLVNSIFPLVLKSRPQALLEVVGAGVPERFRKNAAGEVLFKGRVEDVIPCLGECTLMVLPLRFAGGVRIRMLEAAAMGVPVVSTPAGIRGMNLSDGREYIEASKAGEFADAVVRILEDEKLAGKLSKNARDWAEKEISLETYPERLQMVFEELLNKK